ncbi:hypothetical protein B7494_g3281 [Chlorociboria aeruginascens]|nr:hypothetical protein B7494_g3281 [Chlorociboria aeruginascens]
MHAARTLPDLVEGRPYAPRIFKPRRQRTRKRGVEEAKNKGRPILWTGTERTKHRMEEDNRSYRTEAPSSDDEDLIDRATLCLPHFGKDCILHGGDEGYKDVLRQYCPSAESNALERLVHLKSRLRVSTTHDFWSILMEEMCEITGAQCSLVAKRMLVDDQDSAIEMPDLGEPGSCLMSVAFYVNNGTDVKELYRNYRYHAYGTPCAHMKHDKVFIVPEKLAEFTPNNPNTMPWKQSEAFIGVPLFMDGKCFAHFCLIWSSEGAAERKLSWTFIEMFMHSLEDIILQRIEEGRGFTKDTSEPESTSAKVIPLSAITAFQSLKPYARSLSHELRTPMQGIVGMLDIMHSTVVDAIIYQVSEESRAVFETLKTQLEVVQDSSKRAVEAADNVVYAYDLNMEMPETPLTPEDVDSIRPFPRTEVFDPSVEGIVQELSPSMNKKRERSEGLNLEPGSPLKRIAMATDPDIKSLEIDVDIPATGPSIPITNDSLPASAIPVSPESLGAPPKMSPLPSPSISPTPRCTDTRQFMRSLVSDTIRNGHPTSQTHIEMDLGETIRFSSCGSRGEVLDRMVHLSIATDVPDVVIMDEQNLKFPLQKVVDNAIKFTESGSITLTVKLGKHSQTLEIRVLDTGCGITEESKPHLFEPHFQEDASLSRSKDGLGLSLFNAKAHTRKHLGGDVTLERSSTEGPSRGSEFLIRLPVFASEIFGADIPVVGMHARNDVAVPHRPSPWTDSSTSSNPVSFGSSTSSSSVSILGANATSPPRKRTTFNRNLAKDRPLNILIAEDNAINRGVAVAFLNKLGYGPKHITVVFDGAEAVNQYKESLLKPPSERFDVILMDIWMPNMDGYEATHHILQLAEGQQQVPAIVAVTADITRDSIMRAKEAGMQRFLAKPYTVCDLEALIEQYFRES